MYQTYYTVKDPKGTILFGNRTGANSCFYSYAFNQNGFVGNREIDVYIKKEYPKGGSIYNQGMTCGSDFTVPQLQEYCEGMNAWGFPMEFRDNGTDYSFFLKECDYFCLGHVRVALDWLRLLWESGMPKIYKKYLSFPKEVKESMPMMEIMQLLSIQMRNDYSGHRLPTSPSGGLQRHFTVFSREQLIQYFYERVGDKNRAGYGTFASWYDLSNRFFNTKYKITTHGAEGVGHYSNGSYVHEHGFSTQTAAKFNALKFTKPEELVEAKNIVNKL